MLNNYSGEALRLEKLALSKKNASKNMKNLPQKVNTLEQAARMYEVAVKNWLLEAKENSLYPRKEKYAQKNASHDYGLAKRLREEIREQSLEAQIFGIIAIISLATSLFFTSFNLSGYATGSLSGDASILGIVLFVLGLVFAFVFFRKKNKKF